MRPVFTCADSDKQTRKTAETAHTNLVKIHAPHALWLAFADMHTLPLIGRYWYDGGSLPPCETPLRTTAYNINDSRCQRRRRFCRSKMRMSGFIQGGMRDEPS